MQSSNLFWPSDRKLFRQRSRVRLFVPIIAVLAAALLTLAVGPAGWS